MSWQISCSSNFNRKARKGVSKTWFVIVVPNWGYASWCIERELGNSDRNGLDQNRFPWHTLHQRSPVEFRLKLEYYSVLYLAVGKWWISDTFLFFSAFKIFNREKVTKFDAWVHLRIAKWRHVGWGNFFSFHLKEHSHFNVVEEEKVHINRSPGNIMTGCRVQSHMYKTMYSLSVSFIIDSTQTSIVNTTRVCWGIRRNSLPEKKMYFQFSYLLFIHFISTG